MSGAAMRRRILVVLSCLMLAPVASADVVESTANGFTTKTVTEISAVPRSVYLTLTAQVGNWWDPQHTWSGNARNMAIDPRAGGCFCEKLANGGSVQHMTVILAEPGKTLRMRGALGPLQEQAVVGTITWTLTDTGSRTRLEMTYVVGGYMRGGLEPVAKIVDSVLATQVQRLKQYIESGRPS
jgi:uncharacterized protein YndB with AHSA1/START domain